LPPCSLARVLEVSQGRILAAEHDGAYALKFVGDVRVNLCTTIDDYFERMFQDPCFESVLVDLCEAEGIDSTTLGLLAKLALRIHRQHGLRPAIYSSNSGINRLLASMAFNKIFEIREESCDTSDCIDEIPAVGEDAASAREKVIEAHRILMDMSEENQERFQDLMAVLEQG
jgi:anti-anti-sigma factor